MVTLIAGVYFFVLGGLTLFGLVGVINLVLYGQYRHQHPPLPAAPAEWPLVTVQLPIFNEPLVVERLIQAAVGLNYPAGRLEIQVLDDSTDETTAIAQKLVENYQQQGVNIQLYHRQNRAGYKAGALAEGLQKAQGEFIAIFDADFQPPADFLHQTVPYFQNKPQLGLIQTRWGHLNAEDSTLTLAQAIALDKHFMIEQLVRQRAGLYPKFNGTAGVWRRSCMETAGGWASDTVCEDLCLSTRAGLQGWHFLFLPQVITPGELPNSLTAYKTQQARWAKGSWQCVLKFWHTILTDPGQPLPGRLYTLLTMSGYLSHFLVLLMILLQLPLVLYRFTPPSYLMGLSVIGLSQPFLFIFSQYLCYPRWWRRLPYLPALLLITLGLGPTILYAIGELAFKKEHDFVRTPKGKRLFSDSLPSQHQLIFGVELSLLLYVLITAGVAWWMGFYAPLFFLLFCIGSFGYTLLYSWQEYQQVQQQYGEYGVENQTRPVSYPPHS